MNALAIKISFECIDHMINFFLNFFNKRVSPLALTGAYLFSHFRASKISEILLG